MKILQTPIEGLLLIEPAVFRDERGYFFESFNEKLFSDNGIDVRFIQDNQSLSHKGALRGLHFQAPPFAQGKLVRVIQGSVLDVAVDIRKGSATYGKHYDYVLSGENNMQLWIPAGFAHGFVTLENNTIFSYKCTGLYNKASEGGILWNDPQLNINWNASNPILSAKDLQLPLFKNFNSPF